MCKISIVFDKYNNFGRYKYTYTYYNYQMEEVNYSEKPEPVKKELITYLREYNNDRINKQINRLTFN